MHLSSGVDAGTTTTEGSGVTNETAPQLEKPRRKAPGRNALQERQREETRRRLVEAAGRVFERKSYVDTRVEDVLAEAGVSRATFYAHFDGKLALVSAIAAEFMPQWRKLFDRLVEMPAFTPELLDAWTRAYVDIYRRNEATCILLTQVSALETDFYWQLADAQAALIDQLADHIPAFARAQQDDAVGRSMRVRAALLLSQLDQVSYFLAVRRWKADPEEGIRIMADQIGSFLNMRD